MLETFEHVTRMARSVPPIELPPGPRLPAVLQTVQWVRRPEQFLERCRDRHGDPFTLRFPGLGTFVFFSEPSAIREIFTG